MINLRNTLVLAGTKLKTRKLRLIVTTIISSLVFGVIAVAIIIFTGFMKSVEQFSQQGLNNRFFVQANHSEFGDDFYRYIETREGRVEAKKVAEQIVEREAKRAKELGLEYDKKAELNNLITTDRGEPVTDKNIDSLVVNGERLKKVLRENFSKNQKSNPEMALTIDNLKRISANYNPVDYIKIDSFRAEGNHAAPNENGQYPIDPKNQDGMLMAPEALNKHLDSDDASQPKRNPVTGFNVVPETIAKAYRFGDIKWRPESGTIPIMVSIDEAEKMLDLKALPQNASAKDALDRQQEIISKIKGYKLKQCYRNQLAMEQLMLAYNYNQIKDEKDAPKPNLIYGLPDNGACAVAKVLEDKRSAQEKKIKAAQDLFDVEFRGRDAVPIAKELTFEVTGLLPNSGYTTSGGLVSNLIRMAIGSPFLSMISTDAELAQALETQGLQTVFKQQSSEYGSAARFMVELPNLETAKKFYKEHGCDSSLMDEMFDYPVNSGATSMSVGSRGPTKCTPERPFYLNHALNNRVALDDVTQGFAKVLVGALTVAVIIATIIMGLTVGRMIADSRRETAVFRAIGFKRFDISLVYGLYTLIICCLVIMAVISLGLIGSSLISSRLSEQMTTQAILATNSIDSSIRFSLVGFSPVYLGMLVGAILVVGLLAIVLPLLRNLRRNPIKDMRDE